VGDESKVIKELEKLGLVIVRDETRPCRPFEEVVWISKQVSDRGLQRLFALKDPGQTRVLYLSGFYGGNISDAGLVPLKKLDRLEDLTLKYTAITDAGLVHLKNLDRLEKLSLTNTAITDAGLKHLKGLRRLRSLDLHGTNVTDQGVAELQKALPEAIIDHKIVQKYNVPFPHLFRGGGTGGMKYAPQFYPGR
jgi:hypothetical protein